MAQLKLSLRPILEEVMADGRWHPIDEIVARVAHLIPPETAARRLPTVERRALPARLAQERGKRRVVMHYLYRLGATQQGRGAESLFCLAPQAPPVILDRDTYDALVDEVTALRLENTLLRARDGQRTEARR